MSAVITTVEEIPPIMEAPILLNFVPSYNLQKLSDERSKTLRSLLQQNHRELALLLDPNLFLHSHMPHKLGSAYLLGFSSEKMIEMREREAAIMKNVNDGFIQTGVTRENWREFLNNKKYTVALTNFFDQEVSNSGGSWKRVLSEFLFGSPQPLINGFVGGLGHPLIHLAYAYELESAEVATEALSLGCTERDYTHQFLDESCLDTSTYKTTSLREILEKVHTDYRFVGLLDLPGFANITTIFKKAQPAVLEHWHAWEITDPSQQLEEALSLTTTLLMGSRNESREYDFYLAHTLTVGHAVRLLLPYFAEEWTVPLLRQFGMFILFIYIAQLRPAIKDVPDLVVGVEVEGRDWKWVSERAMLGDFFSDSHRLKVLRALKVIEDTWGKKDGLCLKAAVTFVDDFNGWTGFGRGFEDLIGDE